MKNAPQGHMKGNTTPNTRSHYRKPKDASHATQLAKATTKWSRQNEPAPGRASGETTLRSKHDITSK